MTSADGQLLTARGDPDADDLAGLGNQFLGAGIGLRRDAGVQQSFEQSGDQRRAGHAQIGRLLVDRRMQASPGLGVESDVGPVRRERRDPITPLAELVQIERRCAQRAAAARAAAGQLWFVIRETGGDLETQTTVRLDEVEHRRAGPHERVD